MRALSIASTGMQAQQTNVEVIANNLANMNTTAFKQQRAEFADLLYQNIQTPGSQTSDQGTYAPNGIQLGAGVRTAAVYRINTQGDLKSTGNPYDVAIQGSGFFRIQQADGTDAYTRSGNFSLSPQGQLVTQDGLVVQPGIAIPANTLTVTRRYGGTPTGTVTFKNGVTTLARPLLMQVEWPPSAPPCSAQARTPSPRSMAATPATRPATERSPPARPVAPGS